MFKILGFSLVSGWLLIFMPQKALASRVNDTLYCLKIDGKIDLANFEGGKNCLVELLCEDKVVEKLVLKNKKRSFKLQLAKNKQYMIRLSQEGSVARLISVDTKIVKEINDTYTFYFETKLPKEEETERLNKHYLEQPIAMIFFDEKRNRFVYDKDYTKRVKEHILRN